MESGSIFGRLRSRAPIAPPNSRRTTPSSADPSDGWDTPPGLYDNTTSGDVFWAQKGNSSIMYLNDAGRFVLKGKSCRCRLEC